MYLWIGANVNPSTIQNLFGVSAVQQLNVEKVYLELIKKIYPNYLKLKAVQILKCKILEIDTPISMNVRSVISQINEQRKCHLKLVVLRQNDTLELFFKNLLVEDKGISQNNLSYVEYLYHLHREIKNILS